MRFVKIKYKERIIKALDMCEYTKYAVMLIARKLKSGNTINGSRLIGEFLINKLTTIITIVYVANIVIGMYISISGRIPVTIERIAWIRNGVGYIR
ncbi:MAG: hypothetical protein QXP98_03985 [Thermoproteus sp.]